MAKKVACEDESADFNDKSIKSSMSTSKSQKMSRDYSLGSKKMTSEDQD